MTNANPIPAPEAARTAAEPAAPSSGAAATASPPRPAAPRRPDSSRCHTPGCTKYHELQWNGKYYCLECYEALRSAALRAQAAAAAK